jgi:hypothetical protein
VEWVGWHVSLAAAVRGALQGGKRGGDEHDGAGTGAGCTCQREQGARGGDRGSTRRWQRLHLVNCEWRIGKVAPALTTPPVRWESGSYSVDPTYKGRESRWRRRLR